MFPQLRKITAGLLPALALLALAGGACKGSAAKTADSADSGADTDAGKVVMTPAAEAFSADSAFAYLRRQVEFGPRVPNTPAHRAAGDWILSRLRQWCDTVIVQEFSPLTFDNTRLQARNFFGQINPGAADRILLLAHWDCRPWADQDPDPAKRKTPVDGANDGASGVAVLLEVARALKAAPQDKGIDILFVDAEDWGSEGDDDSWALGARYFAQHLPIAGYAPKEAVLLDMVGGKEPVFCKEYFSEQSNPSLNARIWSTAASLGYGDIFRNIPGGAVTDDHVQLIEAGIPAVDIIEYHPESGFNPTWHTTADTPENIEPKTLEAVGKTLLQAIL